jgi:HSP20 family molecular chaperone IbpA
VVEVFLGKQKLGASDQPIRVKRSETKVKLTFKAAGYVPKDIEVAADTNGDVPVTLTRASATVKKQGNSEVEF